MDTLIKLRAGPLTMIFVAGGLRDIKVGGFEVVSHIYAAVRDENWGTVPGQLGEVVADVRADSFEVSFVSEHRQGETDFIWRGRAVGSASGGLEFTFSGSAMSTFQRNRIGFCVLHPASLAGVSYRAEHTCGAISAGAFPTDIAPHQPVLGLRALRHAAGPDAEVELRFEGDTFEMEDQRNWTDASYKTYCTPLAEPYPVTMRPGEQVEQRVAITFSGTVPAEVAEASFSVAVDTQNPVPLLELGLATNETQPSTSQLERLRALNLAHLRVDVDLEKNNKAALERAAASAEALGARLELALHVGENPDAELSRLSGYVHTLGVPLARWLVFGKGAKSTPGALLEDVRTALHHFGAPIGGGTDAFFTELNREPPPSNLFDLVVYSLNPQVHAFDDASLVETLPVQGTTVDGARKLAGGKPVAIGPVTLKMRWNPNAAAPSAKDAAHLEQRDPRQHTLFNAAWTLGSIKYLAQHGAASVTYFETVGPLGVLDAEGVFPVFHVFADVGAFAGGEVYPSRSNDPRVVESLVLTKGDRVRVLLSNYTLEPVAVEVAGIEGSFSCRILDEANVRDAKREPEMFRAQKGTPLELPGPVFLPPHGYTCLDRR